MNKPSKYAGFSIVEIMITLAIMAILSAIALPSFDQMIRKNKANSAAEALISSWNLARAESISNGGNVTLSAHSSCTAKNWQCGWNIKNSSTTIQSIESQKMLKITNNKTNSIEFNRYGRPNSGAHQFLIQPEGKNANDHTESVLLCINAGGNIRKIPNIQGAPSCQK